MSASREKKDRRELFAQGMTERQKREQQEAAKKRTQNILFAAGGVVLAILVITLLVWNSGIFQRGSTALTINGKKYGPTDVSYFYQQALNNAWYNEQYMVSLYQAYGMEYTPAFDASGDLTQQWVDEEKTQSFHDYFLETAKKSLMQAVALRDAAAAEGYVPPQEDADTITSNLADMKSQATSYNYSLSAYLKAIYGRLMTEADYRRNMELSVTASSYYTAKTGEMADYTDADLMAYYQENPRYLDTYDYERCYFDGTAAGPVDENGEAMLDEAGNEIAATEAEKAAALADAKARAEAMTAAVQAGGDFAELAVEYAAEEDKLELQFTGATHDSQLGNDLKSYYYGEWLTDPERKENDAEMFEAGGSGFYVVQYKSKALDNTQTVDFRHILFMAEIDEDAEEPTVAQMEAAHVKAMEALDRFEAGETPNGVTFGEIADELTEDEGSQGNGGLYSGVKKGDMVENIDTWIFDPARKSGDTILAENFGLHYYGWHVVYFQDHGAAPWRTVAETAKKDADIAVWMESVETGYEFTEGSGMNYVK